MVERRFAAMGTEILVLVGDPFDPHLPSAEPAAAAIEAEIVDFGLRLSRFRPESELCLLNDAPGGSVPASPLLRDAVRAGIWAAERTGGLVDPTLVVELEQAGYGRSLAGVRAPSLADALAGAPPRNRARPAPDSRWRSIAVDDPTGTISRPAGVAFDTGGIGKGLAADLAARRLRSYGRWVIDCGGDLRVGGIDPVGAPIELEVRHPLTGEAAASMEFAAGAAATSGIDARLWETGGDPPYAHHLLDPADGTPAWTGLIAATALAPTALEADVLAKAALLSGPVDGPAFLAEHGGLLVHDDGTVRRFGPMGR